MARDSTLLAEIERDVLDAKPLADLLRKCIMLGGRSGSQELRAWAGKELRGYRAEDDLPSYRSVNALIMLDGVSGNWQFTGQRVPESSLPDFVREAGLGETVQFRGGVGELEALVAGRKPDEGIHLAFPGGDVLGEMFDKASGNPFQHTHRIYWSVVPPTIISVLDNVRTTLAELITELIASVPIGQDVPTAEQADNAFQVAVHGKRSQVHITAPQVSGGSVSAITQAHSTTAESGDSDEPGWWTFGRKVWATVVSLFVVAGAIAAILVLV